MKPKYRNRTEIIASVLEATKGGSASKTRIMFNAYLSYEQLNEYLNEVLEKELLAYDFHTQTYNITPKGSKFLELVISSEVDAIIHGQLPIGSKTISTEDLQHDTDE